ncbi:ABC transporter ATP-binding protein [Pelosinus sp. UFO1]|uniref:ABC transporter ATP-binding protein n=1 Tax=Pelosinus sp. UFO1 TaxID=484770 RepID=UPI0004D1B437|nr:ABC transporter ATP-binding protein [Pelosinus sp. UFO1]AIF52415.1 Taurine-transporting ATPase [Pelosinus sp. UFO1]
MTKITAQNVTKVFNIENEEGKVDQLFVLNDFQLEVKKGEFLAILGPSGCGKSTFLNILGGLDKQTSGDIYVDDQPVVGSGNNLGYVFQAYALFPWRTVLENIEIGLEIRGVGKSERKKIAKEYITLVGLDQFSNRYPHELSGGMKQRVAIARALAYQPEVLLMDEPFAALDAQTRELLQLELLRIWENNNKTVLFVTHSIDEAIFLADRVAVMTARPGKIKEIIEIPLPRPRTGEIRNSNAFAKIRHQAWELLKDEVLLAQDPSIRTITASLLEGETEDKKRGQKYEKVG